MRPDRDTPAPTPAERRDQLDREVAEATRSGRTVAHWVEAGRPGSYAASERAAANHRTPVVQGRDLRTPEERALARLVRVHRFEYEALVAAEIEKTF